MNVGILEILTLAARRPTEMVQHLVLTKQYASVTPQAISVWCREMGHRTSYGTYYGLGDPAQQLPSDLDVVFISTYTWASALAYALAKRYRRAGVRTVIGGPHANAFPTDCLRFFDLVVKTCDKRLVADILAGHCDPGSVVSSQAPFEDAPTVEERMPEIRRSAFLWNRRRYFTTAVPMLASVGCPYSCDFCVDWNNPYRLLPVDRLAADLRFLSTRLPGVLLAFQDPNFGIKFEQILDVLETIPPGSRNPYLIETSLSTLRGPRLQRLEDTNCVTVAPGVESWDHYSNKAGVGRKTGPDKVAQVAEHFQRLHQHVPYLQANFIFGLDTDQGSEPIELTKEFMTRTPFVWPTLNIPIPFGGTPLYDEFRRTDRILAPMPFTFYGPYLVTTLKHYDPVTYYEKLIELVEHACSTEMLRRRLTSTTSRAVKLVHWVRTTGNRAWLRSYRRVLQLLRSDREFRGFHEGRSSALPEFYHRLYEQGLGPYAELISRRDRTPRLQPATSTASQPGPHGPAADAPLPRSGGGPRHAAYVRGPSR